MRRRGPNTRPSVDNGSRSVDNGRKRSRPLKRAGSRSSILRSSLPRGHEEKPSSLYHLRRLGRRNGDPEMPMHDHLTILGSLTTHLPLNSSSCPVLATILLPVPGKVAFRVPRVVVVHVHHAQHQHSPLTASHQLRTFGVPCATVGEGPRCPSHLNSRVLRCTRMAGRLRRLSLHFRKFCRCPCSPRCPCFPSCRSTPWTCPFSLLRLHSCFINTARNDRETRHHRRPGRASTVIVRNA